MFEHGQKVVVLRGRHEGLTVVFDSYSDTRPDRCYVTFVGFSMRGAMLNVSDIAPVESAPCVRAEAERLAKQYGLDPVMMVEKLKALQALSKQRQNAHIDELVAELERKDTELHESYQSSASFRSRLASALAHELHG